MRIGIAGLGSSGTYLAKRLTSDGFDVTSFDPKRPDYYIPCGYAANEKIISQLMNNIGVDFSQYVLSRARNVTFTGTNMPEIVFNSAGLCTFDKNRLENDIIAGLNYRNETFKGNFDLIIDATGVSRSILGPAKDDFLMYAREYVCDTAEHEDFHFSYFPSAAGYFWEFPLDGRYHVGAGSSDRDLIDESLNEFKPARVTARMIRLKPLFDQMFRGNAIGVGESIGTVSPVTGEGIMPSIECAELLREALGKYSDLQEVRLRYSESVKKRFSHYEKLFSLLMNFRNGKKFYSGNVKAIGSVVRTMKEFGIDFKLRKVLRHIM